MVTALPRVSIGKREVHREQMVCVLHGPRPWQPRTVLWRRQLSPWARRAAYPCAQDPGASGSVTTDALVSSSTYQLRVDQLEEVSAVGGGRWLHPGATNEDRWGEAEEDPWRRGSASRVEARPDPASPELRSRSCRDSPSSLSGPECVGPQPPPSLDWGCAEHLDPTADTPTGGPKAKASAASAPGAPM